MSRIRPKDVVEAENLLAEVASWTEQDLNSLPPLYREKAREYRKLVPPQGCSD